jgi:phosphotransacetylase
MSGQMTEQMTEQVFSSDFDVIVDRAKALEKPIRVVIAGADVENILLGAFDAQASGFVYPILVGNHKRIWDMLDRLGLKDRDFDLQAVSSDINVVQYAIDMILAGEADVLMRGNTQTRDFLMPVLNKSNHLLDGEGLMTHVVMLKIPGVDKITAISDATILVRPSIEQRKEVIKNMVRALKLINVEHPNIALLSLVEKPSFHMKDTVEAQTLVLHQAEEHFADCNLVGPIPYDLIVSKEAARLKKYDCEFCGEFDGIVAPDLMSGNLMIKVLETNARANSFGVIVGAKIPIAITSRSDSKEQAYLSLAACAVMSTLPKYKDWK